MGVLDDYRAQHPEYKDIPDQKLGDALFQKFYADKMPRDQFDAKAGLKKPEQPNTFIDMARSIPGGLAKGAVSMLGIPGDINNGLQWLAGKGMQAAGLESPEQSQAITSKLAGLNPMSSESLSQVPKAIGGGDYYKPQTIPGQYTETAASFAPSAIGAPSMAAALGRVAAPALASETAGQLTKGTPAEPYARFGGAVLGGGLQGLGEGYLAERAQTAATPTTAQVQQGASNQYQAIRGTPVTVTPEMQNALSGDLGRRALDHAIAGAEARPQPEFQAIGRELRDFRDARGAPANIPLAPQEVAERAALGGRGYGDLSPAERATFHESIQPGPAAPDARTLSVDAADRLSRAFRDIGRGAMRGDNPNTDLSAGAFARRAGVETTVGQVPEVQPARQAYAQGMKSADIDAAIQRAVDSPATPAGASGLHQAIKREFRGLVRDDDFMHGLTAAEQTAVRRAANGTITSNTLQRIGVFSPLRNHLSAMGQLLTVGANPAAAIGTAGAGIAGQMGGNFAAMRNARLASELVRSGGTTAPLMGARARDAAAMAALLARPQ